MHVNLATSADFFHKYGNVGRNADDLLKSPPTMAQLWEAKRQALVFVDRATIEMMRHYKIGVVDVEQIRD